LAALRLILQKAINFLESVTPINWEALISAL
jgi:hypothetical protein